MSSVELERSFASDWHQVRPPPDFDEASIPLIAVEAVSTCPVCGENDFGACAVAFDYELLTCRNSWRFVRCGGCGHVWLNPRPGRATLPVIYPPSYYAYNYEEQINSIATWGKSVLDRFKLRSILRHLGRAPSSYLDVGCGNGRFLWAMETEGISPSRIHGIELDHKATVAVAGRGFRIHTCPVEDCEDIEDGSLDLVTMFYVIEHVAEPGAVVRKIRRWLVPGGILAVETPNWDSLDARLFESGFWGGYHVPRHWNLFIPSTLERMLSASGLELVATLYQTGHAFWMYSFHHKLKYGRRPRRRLAGWFDPFASLPFLALFTAFDKVRAGLGFRTSSMLMLAKKSSTA